MPHSPPNFRIPSPVESNGLQTNQIGLHRSPFFQAVCDPSYQYDRWRVLMRVLFSTIGPRDDVQPVVAPTSFEGRGRVPPDLSGRDLDFCRARLRRDRRSHRAAGGDPNRWRRSWGFLGSSPPMRGGAAVAASCATALAILTWTGLRQRRTTTVSSGQRAERRKV